MAPNLRRLYKAMFYERCELQRDGWKADGRYSDEQEITYFMRRKTSRLELRLFFDEPKVCMYRNGNLVKTIE